MFVYEGKDEKKREKDGNGKTDKCNQNITYCFFFVFKIENMNDILSDLKKGNIFVNGDYYIIKQQWK